MVSTIFNSTILSARRSSVQWAVPSGGWLHAIVISRASCAPSSFRGTGNDSRAFLPSARVRPSSEYFLRILKTVWQWHCNRPAISSSVLPDSFLSACNRMYACLIRYPGLSPACQSPSGVSSLIGLVQRHAVSSLKLYSTYLNKVLPDNIHIFNCPGPLGCTDGGANECLAVIEWALIRSLPYYKQAFLNFLGMYSFLSLEKTGNTSLISETFCFIRVYFSSLYTLLSSSIISRI